MATISGTVRNDAGQLVAGSTVRVYRRDTGALLGEVLTSSAVTGDDFYANVSLLMHMDGADGGSVFTDNSPNPKTKSASTAKTSTLDMKFGTASALFRTGYSERIVMNTSPDFSMGTGDFTVEGWFNVSTSTGGNYAHMVDLRNSTSDGLNGIALAQLDSSLYYVLANNLTTTKLISATGKLTAGWRHIAISRKGTDSRLFLDGIQVGATNTSDTYNYATTGLYIGCRPNFSYYFPGNIDDLRITKGVARYTANFTPPIAAFPNNASSLGGSFSLTDAYTGEVQVVCLDDAAGNLYNDLIFRTTPV